MLVKKNMPSLSGTKANGAKLTYDMGTGDIRYAYVLLELTAGAAAARSVADILSEVRIKVNSKIIRRILGTQLEYMRDHLIEGFSVHTIGNNPYLKLRFAEPTMRTALEEDALGFGMSDVNSFQIELDVNPSATSGELSFEGIQAYEPVPAGSAPFGSVIHYDQLETVAANGAGKIVLNRFPKDMPYYKLHLFSANIASVKVEVDNVIIYEASKNLALADQITDRLNPDANVFTIPFDQRQRSADFLPLITNGRQAGNFSIEVQTTAGASDFQVVGERIGRLSS